MQKGKDRILVTGATGKQGGAVARALLADGHAVRAMTRNPAGPPAKALAASGAEVVHGDLDDPGSLERALEGAWGVFAVQNTWEAGVEREEEQGKRLAELARKKGVAHYVYTSVGSAHRKTGIPHFDNKWRIEEKVRALGFPSHVVLRPVFFMENWLAQPNKGGIDQGKFVIGLEPRTVLQQVAVDDIGAYGKLAFERHADLAGQAIDLAGDALTMPQVAEALSQATGRKVEFVRLPIEEIRKVSEDYALMLEWFDRVGYDADIEGNAKRFGIPPTRFRDWAARQRW